MDGTRSPSQMDDNVFNPASKDKVWIRTAYADVQAERNQIKYQLKREHRIWWLDDQSIRQNGSRRHLRAPEEEPRNGLRR